MIGHNVWGRGTEFLKKMNPLDREQRGVLIAALKASDHIHMNSCFTKPDNKKATHSDWQASGPPYTPTRYAEIDAALANERSRNMVKNVESNTEYYFPSDHFPLEIRFKSSFQSIEADRPTNQMNGKTLSNHPTKWQKPLTNKSSTA